MSVNAAKPFTGRHMLAIMLAFFAVVISANMTMVYYASHSWSGLVVKNSYVASQQFNQDAAELEAVKAALRIVATYDNDVLRMKMTGTADGAFSASHVSVRLGRPATENQDVSFDLTEETAGTYAARQHLAPGIWSGEVSIQSSGGAVQRLPLRIVARASP
jgi:nitrogen fixation protein FixH